MLGFPFFSKGLVESRNSSRLGRLFDLLLVLLVKLLTSFFGIDVSERCKFLRGNVAKVTIHIHGFVIANQGMDPTPGLASLFFKLHQKIHHLARVRSSVKDVSRLHQMGFSTGPALL